MMGHIRRRKTPHGPRFDAITSAGRDPHTRRYSQKAKTFTTRREAEAWLREMASWRLEGGVVNASHLAMSALLDQWLEAMRVQVAQTTFASYDEQVRVHLAPAFGALPTSQLT